ALEDDSARVRRSVLAALGKRANPATAEAVRAVADQARENTSVRIAAIEAVGSLCDREALDILTKLARRAGVAQLPYDRPLGLAALRALGRIRPRDLRTRIAPLLNHKDRRIPLSIRRLALKAANSKGECK
ncbi:HEAT repeat domain-containing protein, partial [Endomicrobium sp. AH-315-J14]|nr:HEAT repeat domain-containing protein [Endomicrobium sp. AH-315-J14]